MATLQALSAVPFCFTCIAQWAVAHDKPILEAAQQKQRVRDSSDINNDF
jgi:hypothetical protein